MNAPTDPDPQPHRKPRVVPFRFLASPFGRESVSNLGVIQSVGASWTDLDAPADKTGCAATTLPTMLLSLTRNGRQPRSLQSHARRPNVHADQHHHAFNMCLTALTPWLPLSTFRIGCGGTTDRVASVRRMVPRTELAAAVLNSDNMARSVGPAIGGAIVAAAGAAAAFASTHSKRALSVLARWRPPVTTQLLPRNDGNRRQAGIRYVAMSPAIRIVLVRGAAFGAGGSAVIALMPLIAKVLIEGGPLTYGALLGAFGVGAIAGAIAAARLRQVLSTEALVRYASIGFAIAAAIADATFSS